MSGQIISRPSGSKAPKKHTTTILPTPVRVESFVPSEVPKDRNGRRFGAPNQIIPVIEVLNNNPGVWHKVAIGSYGSLGAVKLRMSAQDNTLTFETRQESEGKWVLFAVAPDFSGSADTLTNAQIDAI